MPPSGVLSWRLEAQLLQGTARAGFIPAASRRVTAGAEIDVKRPNFFSAARRVERMSSNSGAPHRDSPDIPLSKFSNIAGPLLPDPGGKYSNRPCVGQFAGGT